MGKGKIPLYLILIILGIAVLGYGVKGVAEVRNYNSEWDDFKKNAVYADATVIDKLESKGRYNRSVIIYVKYQDADGNSVTAKIDRYCPGFEEGAEVGIYYDKDHPKKIMVDMDTMYPKGAAPEIPSFIIGGVLIAAGIFAYKRLNR